MYVFLRKSAREVRPDSWVLSCLSFFSHDKQETDEVVQLQEGETPF